MRVPDELGEAIMSCLHPLPEERPTASELALALQPLVAALPKKLILTRRGARPG